jgi:electron transfer flavoprotein alpha subunit
MTNDLTFAHARRVLDQLLAERATALGAGLAHNVMYMDDLEADLEAAREAYVGLAVTEIATLRGELFGAQVG